MYQLLLVPLDGSAFAEHALPMALSLARRHGAALHVVRVYVPVAGTFGEHAMRYMRYDEALERELRKSASAYLDTVVQRLKEVAKIPVSPALLDGPIGTAISRHALASGADLLVMTTHGRGAFARFWLGSIADELVRQSSIPILFARSDEAAPDLTREPILQRVLIPLDGSELAEQVLAPAMALNAGSQTEYTLLRVVAQTMSFNPDVDSAQVAGTRRSLLAQLQELEREDSERAAQYLDQIAEPFRARQLTVNTQVISSQRPAEAILAHASAHSVDLIALTTRGQSGLKRMLLGSVADKILRGADTSVLMYSPIEKSSAGEQDASVAQGARRN